MVIIIFKFKELIIIKDMDDIRQALIKGDGNKLSKKEYKFAVAIERSRLRQQLYFLTFVSFLVGLILFASLYFDIKDWTAKK